MDQRILDVFRPITAEEQAILNGRTSVDWDLYIHGNSNIIHAEKLLSAGKLISIRPHTRFIHFPAHKHDYVEMIYMCSGTTTHIVNGYQITLKQGDLLFLNQSAIHEVYTAEEEDVAVNFIILPEFFSEPLTMIGEEPTPLRSFLINCLCGEQKGTGYLYFNVSSVKQIQNLIENLLWIVIQDTTHKRKMSQLTMALIFLQLLSFTNTLTDINREDQITWNVLQYIEKNYATGSFAEMCAQLHYDSSWLSRQIKLKTGKTFTQLIQEKRLAQAAFLLRTTNGKISDIAMSVGYENISYFHRIFYDAFSLSPRQYRLQT